MHSGADAKGFCGADIKEIKFVAERHDKALVVIYDDLRYGAG